MTNTIEIENLNISDLDIPTDETLQEVATACESIATSSEGIATSCDNIATSCGNLAKDTTLQSTNTALGSLATDATLQATNTALGSISGSLSGFATDTTLQAVKDTIDDLVTAEGTILNTTLGAVAKDATLQATNTALGGIIKDTTGQSIDASVGNISTVLSDVATDTTLATVAKDTTLQATNMALTSLMADTTGQAIASAISALGTVLGSDKANIDGSNIVNPSAFRNAIGIDGALTGTAIKSGYITNNTSATIPIGLIGLLCIYRADTSLNAVVSFYGTSKQTIIGNLPSTITISTNTATNSITINNAAGYTIGVTIIANYWSSL